MAEPSFQDAVMQRLLELVHEAVDLAAGPVAHDPEAIRLVDVTQLLRIASEAEEAVSLFHKSTALRAGAHVVGSIAAEIDAGGNLHIAKTHTPSESITVERADVDDLLVALDAALQEQAAPPATKDLTPSWFIEALQAFALAMLENTGAKKPIDRVLLREDTALQLGIAPGSSVRFATAGGTVEVQSYNGNPFAHRMFR